MYEICDEDLIYWNNVTFYDFKKRSELRNRLACGLIKEGIIRVIHVKGNARETFKALKELGRKVAHFEPDALDVPQGQAKRKLQKRVRQALIELSADLDANDRSEIEVTVDEWIEIHLPERVIPDGKYNCFGEPSEEQLREIRRICLAHEINGNRHMQGKAVAVSVILDALKSYMHGNYFFPQARCHATCGAIEAEMGGKQAPRSVLLCEATTNPRKAVIEYVLGVFDKQNRGSGHSIVELDMGGRKIIDPTWLQFFGNLRPVQGRYPSVFIGTKQDFMDMFGLKQFEIDEYLNPKNK